MESDSAIGENMPIKLDKETLNLFPNLAGIGTSRGYANNSKGGDGLSIKLAQVPL